jgi:hypothetical protein
VATHNIAAAQNGAGFRVTSLLPAWCRRIIRRRLGNAMTPPKITKGITAKNTHCQPSLLVNHAAAGGPTNEGSTHAVEM